MEASELAKHIMRYGDLPVKVTVSQHEGENVYIDHSAHDIRIAKTVGEDGLPMVEIIAYTDI